MDKFKVQNGGRWAYFETIAAANQFCNEVMQKTGSVLAVLAVEQDTLLVEFERITCSRCGGSGHYSYCQMYGTRCFKCHGAGKVFTKRGAAAYQYLLQLRSKPAEQFQPGELVWVDGMPGFTKSGFQEVVRVYVETAAEKTAKGFRSTVNGVEVPQADTYTVESKGCTHGGIAPGTLLRRGCTGEEKAATLKQALAYQATLTKAGTPRKK